MCNHAWFLLLSGATYATWCIIQEGAPTHTSDFKGREEGMVREGESRGDLLPQTTTIMGVCNQQHVTFPKDKLMPVHWEDRFLVLTGPLLPYAAWHIGQEGPSVPSSSFAGNVVRKHPPPHLWGFSCSVWFRACWICTLTDSGSYYSRIKKALRTTFIWNCLKDKWTYVITGFW